MEVRPRQVRPAEVPLDVAVFLPPLVPPLNPLLEDLEMFRVRHCRVTSLASGMLRMIFEGHTVCDSPGTVNAGQSIMAKGKKMGRRKPSLLHEVKQQSNLRINEIADIGCKPRSCFASEM